MEEKILVCVDSFEGIFTGIYEAYARKLSHESTRIQVGNDDNYRLFAEYYVIEPDEEKTVKVARSLQKKLGGEVYTILCRALASGDSQKGEAVYHTIVLALADKGNRVMENLQNDYVRKVFELSRYVWGETHHLFGFLRFEELDNGVLFSKIGPKNNIITFLAPHFSDRFQTENFVIFDENRNLYVVHPARKQWFLVTGEEFASDLSERYSDKELEIQELFRYFCHKIAIKERINPSLQRNMLPLRFRENMTEFQ